MRSTSRLRLYAGVVGAVATAVLATGAAPGLTSTTPWVMHTIVPGSSGAGNYSGSDGVDIADANGDGEPDVVSGHEQGHRVSLSFNPFGAVGGDVRLEWPHTVKLPSVTTRILGPEDAVFADVDGDSNMDVIVGAEADKRVSVLFGPSNPEDLQAVWTRVDIQASVDRGEAAMRVQFAEMDGDATTKDILVGAKEVNAPAHLGYYTSTNPRNPTSWSFHSITPAGWVMQMMAVDMNNDNRLDVLYSDRDPINEDVPEKDSSHLGVRWLQNPGDEDPDAEWTPQQITPANEGLHKWFSYVDWDRDGDMDVIDCRSNETGTINEAAIWSNGGDPASWTRLDVSMPSGVGQCQHATAVDVDGDDAPTLDLAFTSSRAVGLSGVVWLKNTGTVAAPVWERNEISGDELGTKYDNLIWVDLDHDGDLDALTSEQHEGPDQNGPGLGVIWYQNPTITTD